MLSIWKPLAYLRLRIPLGFFFSPSISWFCPFYGLLPRLIFPVQSILKESKRRTLRFAKSRLKKAEILQDFWAHDIRNDSSRCNFLGNLKRLSHHQPADRARSDAAKLVVTTSTKICRNVIMIDFCWGLRKSNCWKTNEFCTCCNLFWRLISRLLKFCEKLPVFGNSVVFVSGNFRMQIAHFSALFWITKITSVLGLGIQRKKKKELLARACRALQKSWNSGHICGFSAPKTAVA